MSNHTIGGERMNTQLYTLIEVGNEHTCLEHPILDEYKIGRFDFVYRKAHDGEWRKSEVLKCELEEKV